MSTFSDEAGFWAGGPDESCDGDNRIDPQARQRVSATAPNTEVFFKRNQCQSGRRFPLNFRPDDGIARYILSALVLTCPLAPRTGSYDSKIS
jgi:hypothetical protein